ncbi:hypothetical protein [Wielerella bovis]|nr:hypothetical protein [Wielerella bovis]
MFKKVILSTTFALMLAACGQDGGSAIKSRTICHNLAHFLS